MLTHNEALKFLRSLYVLGIASQNDKNKFKELERYISNRAFRNDDFVKTFNCQTNNKQETVIAACFEFIHEFPYIIGSRFSDGRIEYTLNETQSLHDTLSHYKKYQSSMKLNRSICNDYNANISNPTYTGRYPLYTYMLWKWHSTNIQSFYSFCKRCLCIIRDQKRNKPKNKFVRDIFAEHSDVLTYWQTPFI